MASGFGRAIMARIERQIEAINDNVRNAIDDLAIEGVQITDHHVSTRGINKPGRIDTGKMIESIDWTIDKNTETEYQVSFGFKNQAPYYTVFQELGTRAIPPMYALTDAASEIEDKVDSVVSQAIRKGMK